MDKIIPTVPKTVLVHALKHMRAVFIGIGFFFKLNE